MSNYVCISSLPKIDNSSLLKFIEILSTLINFNKFLINFNCQFSAGLQRVFIMCINRSYFPLHVCKFDILRNNFKGREI